MRRGTIEWRAALAGGKEKAGIRLFARRVQSRQSELELYYRRHYRRPGKSQLGGKSSPGSFLGIRKEEGGEKGGQGISEEFAAGTARWSPLILARTR